MAKFTRASVDEVLARYQVGNEKFIEALWLRDGFVSVQGEVLVGMAEELAAANAEIERLRAEVEDARTYITTDDGSKLHIRNLLRCGMRSLKRKRGVFWANVADAFGVGSTSAHRLCRFVLLDPDTGERTEDHPHA